MIRGLRLVLVLLAVLGFGLFAVPNWTPVAVVLGATTIDIRLPVLLLLVFLGGFLPVYLTHRWARGRWAARLVRAGQAPVVTAAAEPLSRALPSEAQPTIVPPACG